MTTDLTKSSDAGKIYTSEPSSTHIREEEIMAPQNKPTCAVIHTQQTYTGKQGLTYSAGISADNIGSRGICMHLLTLPPGGRAKAHLHENHETAVYVIRGETRMWYGEKLEQHLVASAGEFVYIPAGMPHLPYNSSQTEPCTALIARTDPNEQESIVLLHELDKLH